MNSTEIIKNSDLFKALGHKNRLEIICLLHGHELTVSQIMQMTGMRQAAVSQHLMYLKSHKLVQAKKLGKELYYSLIDNTILNLSLFLDYFTKSRPLLSEEPVVIDLICHMSLTPSTAVCTTEYGGVRHYFCGKGCYKKFIQETRRL
ncbi:MAG: metalloregulator ArsR/SmtB family transcription factor [Candidatus Moraniibacteriota bacterium]|nr:MAG: metalloregulator ArsR/SmtB family transcription factor [Candidatus Moranbacteria bacterium]